MVSPDRIHAMADAIAAGNVAKVKLLLKAGVPASGADRAPFIVIAAALGAEAIFDLLLESGASIETPELLDEAVDGNGGRETPSASIVRKILVARDHDLPTLTRCLRYACVSGSVNVVQLLLQYGADPNGVDNEFKDFPLLNAVQNGYLDSSRPILRL